MADKKEVSGPYIFDLDFYNEKVTQDAKDWVEANFPDERYGKEILEYIYEAWDLRSLFEMAYMAGKLSKETPNDQP